MVGRIGISEVDLIEVLLFAELVVRDSHVLLTSQLFADIIAHGYIFIIDDVFRAHIAFGANFIFAITLTDFRESAGIQSCSLLVDLRLASCDIRGSRSDRFHHSGF